MKRAVCLLLCGCCLIALCGCSVFPSGSGEPVSFYYRRADYQYHSSENVIVPEQREISGHGGDLQYLVALYLVGPLDDSLILPFPKETRLLKLEESGDSLLLTLSGNGDSLSDSAFSLACACLALTCLSFSNAEEVTIAGGERTMTITPDNLLLTDDITGRTETTEESS